MFGLTDQHIKVASKTDNSMAVVSGFPETTTSTKASTKATRSTEKEPTLGATAHASAGILRTTRAQGRGGRVGPQKIRHLSRLCAAKVLREK